MTCQLALPALDRKAQSLPTTQQQTCDMENEVGRLPSKSAKLRIPHFQHEVSHLPLTSHVPLSPDHAAPR